MRSAVNCRDEGAGSAFAADDKPDVKQTAANSHPVHRMEYLQEYCAERVDRFCRSANCRGKLFAIVPPWWPVG